jgi:hypothetical protein
MIVRMVAIVALLLLPAASPAPAVELPIPRPFEPCPDGKARLAAQTPSDLALESRVEGNLSAAAFERMTDVEVTAIGGVVCLRGRAANMTDWRKAETTAAATKGVIEVVNKLRIPLAE